MSLPPSVRADILFACMPFIMPVVGSGDDVFAFGSPPKQRISRDFPEGFRAGTFAQLTHSTWWNPGDWLGSMNCLFAGVQPWVGPHRVM